MLRDGIRAAVEPYAAHRDVQRARNSIAARDDDAAGALVRRMEADRARGTKRLARGLHEQAPCGLTSASGRPPTCSGRS